MRAKASDGFGPVGPAVVTGVDYNNLLLTTRLNGEIVQQENMEEVLLEKPPEIAVYSPPNMQPWDDAVMLALEYAEIPYTVVWDKEVQAGELARFVEQGKVRAIGVSNFMPEHLQRLLDETGVTPALNQVELHPRLQQEELRAFHAQHGIATEAWSPLAQAQLLDDPVVTAIADDLDVSQMMSAAALLRSRT